jgi:hypothetical protein
LLVAFTAMLNPHVSIAIAVIAHAGSATVDFHSNA